MDSSDMLRVIHAAPLFAAKRRGNKARQRGAFEGLKTLPYSRRNDAGIKLASVARSKD